MAEAAHDLGLQYLGIADHSKISPSRPMVWMSGACCAQIAEIRKLNEEYAGDFRIFAGSEVDILKDGSLDFGDELLADLDYVRGERAQRLQFARGRDDGAHHPRHRKPARHHARPSHRPLVGSSARRMR
jgi:hypothetical protein